MGIQQFLSDRRNRKAEKKSAAAYELMRNQEKYATTDTFMIRLQGDIENFKPFLERIKVEGYDYQLDVIEGSLLSSSIIYVRIKKPGTFEKKFNERKD